MTSRRVRKRLEDAVELDQLVRHKPKYIEPPRRNKGVPARCRNGTPPGDPRGNTVAAPRLRYNFAEGNDLWVVYGHVANTDIDAASPVLPRTDATALTVKFTYTFRE